MHESQTALYYHIRTNLMANNLIVMCCFKAREHIRLSYVRNAIPESVKFYIKKEGFKNALNMFLRKRVRDHLLATVGYAHSGDLVCR